MTSVPFNPDAGGLRSVGGADGSVADAHLNDRLRGDDLSDLDDEYAADAGEPSPRQAATPFDYTLLKDLKPNLTSQFVIKDLLPRAGLGCCYAQPGAGKTAIVIDMALHVAAGREYRGRRVERQPVVFVALEGHSGIDNRVIAAARHLEIGDVPFGVVKAIESFRDPLAAARVVPEVSLDYAAGVATRVGRRLASRPLVLRGCLEVVERITLSIGVAGLPCRRNRCAMVCPCRRGSPAAYEQRRSAVRRTRSGGQHQPDV